MKHREAEALLLDLVEGRLHGHTREAVQRHVDQCGECVAWLDAYQILAGPPSPAQVHRHPDSGLLALCAVRPDELFESDRADLRRHLEICPQCRHEMDLVGAAVGDARPTSTQTTRLAPPWRGSRVWRLAAAAAIGALAVGALLVDGLRRGEPVVDGASTVTATATGGSLDAPSERRTEQFSEAEINGTRLIETDGGLIFSRTRIDDGAVVTIRAGETVAFGDGFQIGSQARVAVGGRPSSPVLKHKQADKG